MCPPALPSPGILDKDPDEVNWQDHAINDCVPQVIGTAAPKKIRLDVALHVAGGWTTAVTVLSYHLVATGVLLTGQDQDDYFAEFP